MIPLPEAAGGRQSRRTNPGDSIDKDPTGVVRPIRNNPRGARAARTTDRGHSLSPGRSVGRRVRPATDASALPPARRDGKAVDLGVDRLLAVTTASAAGSQWPERAIEMTGRGRGDLPE